MDQALVILVLLSLSRPATLGSRALSSGSPRAIAKVENVLGEGPEYAFNLAAFYDGRRGLVRIYTELEPKYVKPIESGDLSSVHVKQCHFRFRNGTTWSTETSIVGVQWAYGDEERIRTINKVIAYIVECPTPKVKGARVAPQLSNGVVLGQLVDVEIIETERQGRLAACSQPLFTLLPGLKDWVDYHAHLGVEKFHMHLPIGSHVDALFDADARDTRIKETTKLNERSPESIGRDRVEVFSHPAVTWQKYYGAPTANYYSETPLFNSCVYRFRYAYEFVMLYDCDEWFTVRRQNSSCETMESIPEFLDKNLPSHVASLQLESFAFPAQCAVSDHGQYPSRFTLRKQKPWENMQKLVVRPLAVACTAIHGIFDITEQFKGDHPGRTKGSTRAEKFRQPPNDVAYIKHIRWFGPPNGTAISCKFGSEVNQWDPEHSLVVQDDFPRPAQRGSALTATMRYSMR